jgi:hypothetical protein
MDIHERDESALESLEEKLYDPKGKIENLAFHHVRDRKEKELPTSWGEDTPIIREGEEDGGLSFGTKFLIGALILLLSVLAFTAWRVISSRNIVSEKNIDMSLDVTPYVDGGEPTPLIVSIQNKNQVALEEASLTLMYKQGSGAQDEEEKVQEKKDLGTIGVGEFKKQDFSIQLYGGEAEARDLTVKLEYKVKGLNQSFPKVVVTQVVLKTPPLSVHLDGPTLLSAGQSGTYTFTVTNTTGTTSQPSLLMATLPTNFQIEESTPRPTSRGAVWQLAALPPGGTSTVTIAGSLSGNQGETSTVKAVVGSLGQSLSQVGVVYSSQTLDIHLRSSPLVVSYSMDTERGPSESLIYGDKAMLTVHYKNVSSAPLHSVELAMQMTGDAVITKNVVPEKGYYDSVSGTIIWNKANVPELDLLQPEAEGAFVVVIPIVTKGTNSPKLNISISGTATLNEQGDVVVNVAKTYPVQGSASVAASTHYKNSPFQNTGPIPPQPNVDTTYTAHLAVSAQNALQNAKVSIRLPAYVTWKNNSTDPTHIAYDASTRTVIWSIGALDAGKTVTADLGLSVRPSQSHVGTSPAITSGIILDADEVVSKAHLKITISPLTTYIAGESWPVNPSLVVDH